MRDCDICDKRIYECIAFGSAVYPEATLLSYSLTFVLNFMTSCLIINQFMAAMSTAQTCPLALHANSEQLMYIYLRVTFTLHKL